MMDVRALMTADPDACLPSDNCATVGAIMRRRQCGFVPVVDSHKTQRLVGVVTDRDVALHLTRTDRPASQERAEACMTKQVEFISPSAGIEDAVRIMETSAIHRLPVVEDGRVIGVLSLRDLALAARDEWAVSGPHRLERKLLDAAEAIATVQGPRRGACGCEDKTTA